MRTLIIASVLVVAALILGSWLVWFSPWARKQRGEHEAAWAGFTDPDPSGLSQLQRECERRLAEVLASRGLSLRNRRIEEDPLEPYQAPSTTREARNRGCMIVADMPELGAEVWISGDQTDISSPSDELRLEEWDTKTPDEHYETVVSFVRSLPLIADEGAA